MAKSFLKAQDLTRGVYLSARRIVLRSLDKTVDELDALYAKDAERLKRELGRVLKLHGFPARQVESIIDKVMTGSRAERVKVVRKAIEDAARTGRKLDKATFDAVFGKDKDASPKAKGRSGLRLIETPSQSPVTASVDKSSSRG